MHAPGAENLFDYGSFGLRKLSARDTKLGTWVHLGKAYLAPSVLNASFSRGPEGHTGGATDPKLAGHTHTVPT